MSELVIDVCWWRIRSERETELVTALCYVLMVLFYVLRKNIRCSGVEWTLDSKLNLWEAQYHVFRSGKHSSFELMSCSPIGFWRSSMTIFVTALLIHFIFSCQPVQTFNYPCSYQSPPPAPHSSIAVFLVAVTHFLSGAFAKLLRRVRLSVRMEQLGYHQMDFHEIWYFSIFRKSAEEVQVSLKSDQNNGGLYMKSYVHLW